MKEQTVSKVPKIRFKGFEEEWQEEPILSRIKSVIDFRGRTPKKLGLDWSPSGYLALSALNVKDGYIDRYADAHYGDEELYTKWMKGNELHCNQVLFTTEAPMGNVAQIPDTQKYILSQRTIAFVTDAPRLSEDFLAVLLKSPNVFQTLLARSSGGTAKGVSQKTLSSIHVRVSDELTEQTQIGGYFRLLDRLIGLHQRKHDKLVTLKKAMLQKMFPQPGATTPEIRFKEFEGDWKPCELGEITTKIGSGKTPRGGKTGYLTSGIPLIRSQNIFSDSVNFEGIVFISDETDEEMSNSRVLQNDVLLNITGASIGRSAVYRSNESANVNQHVCIIRANGNHHSGFIQLNLASTRGQAAIDNSQAGGAREGLNFQQIGKIIFQFPSHTEQQKIGTYFRTLDSLISKHATQLQKLQQIKSACLEKMFV